MESVVFEVSGLVLSIKLMIGFVVAVAVAVPALLALTGGSR